jgi:threonine dehydratase
MGLEIVEQVPNLDAVVIPVGGAGLLAGVSLAVKTLRPDAKIVAVEAENVASFSAALETGKPTKITMHPTLADGLAIPQVGANAFQIARPLVDLTIAATEEEIALAILRLVELEKSVVEGAAATPLAGCMSGKLKELAGRRVVLLLCGGNIDPNVLSRVIERGLVADGRLGRFTAVISDRPGGLADLAAQIASTGASVKQVVHDRAFASADVSAVNVLCTVETRNHQHLAELRALLKSLGVEIHDAT